MPASRLFAALCNAEFPNPRTVRHDCGDAVPSSIELHAIDEPNGIRPNVRCGASGGSISSDGMHSRFDDPMRRPGAVEPYPGSLDGSSISRVAPAGPFIATATASASIGSRSPIRSSDHNRVDPTHTLPETRK
jgi:hypothetical protein